MKRFITPVLASIALLAACGQSEDPAARGSIAAATQGQPVMVSHCYLQVTKGAPRMEGNDTIPGTVDSLYIRLDILGELANGVYNWLPGEKDRMTGTFQGSIEDSVITALYSYSAEGQTQKQEVLFKMGPGGLRIATGELVLSEGVNLFKDKSKCSFGEPVPEVPCK